MSTLELKNWLIDEIQKTENEGLLEEICRLIKLESQEIEVYKLNAEQREAICEALQQINNNEFLTSEQADHEIDEWLKK